MRLAWLVGLVGLAACELQPAPKQAPPPPSAQPVTTPTPSAAPADAAPAPDAADVTHACLDVGVHVAQVLIDGATDPGVKAQYEQARTKIVRATAEACTSQTWTPEAQRCFTTANNVADVRACEKKFPPPGAVAPPPPAHPAEG